MQAPFICEIALLSAAAPNSVVQTNSLVSDSHFALPRIDDKPALDGKATARIHASGGTSMRNLSRDVCRIAFVAMTIFTSLATNSDAATDLIPPTFPDLKRRWDTGRYDNDNVTSLSKIRLSYDIAAEQSYIIYHNNWQVIGTIQGLGLAYGGFNEFGPFTEGVHTFFMSATSPLGWTGYSPTLTVTIDTTAPATPAAPDLTPDSDSGSSTTDNLTNDTTPTFIGTVEPNAVAELISADTGLAIASQTTGADGAYSLTAPLQSDGTRGFAIRATVLAGNSATGPDLSITIGTTVATPGAPDMAAASDSGRSDSDDITQNTTPTLSGTGTPNASVAVTDATQGLLGTVTADLGGVWTLTPTLSERSHSITARQTDIAGNLSDSSAALILVIDITAPARPPNDAMDPASDHGWSSTDRTTNNTTPTFTGTTEPGATVEMAYSIYLGLSGSPGVVVADGSGNWQLTTAALIDNEYDVTLMVSDAAGNQALLPIHSSFFIIDTVPPSAPGTPDLTAATDSGVSDSDDITLDTLPHFVGTGDASAHHQLVSSVDGTQTSFASGTSFTLAASPALSEGVHQITFLSTDAAGNTAASASALTLTIDTTPPAALTAPDLYAGSDGGISDTDNLTNQSLPTFTGTGAPGTDIVLTSNLDGVIGQTMVSGAGGWSFTVPIIPLTPGTQMVTAQTTDIAGNLSPASAALTFTLDLTPPGIPTLDLDAASDSGASDTDNITNDTTPTFSGTAEAGGVVYLVDTIEGALRDAFVPPSGGWTLTLTAGLSEGAHSITVVAQDAAGNLRNSAPLALTIDVTPPSVAGQPDLS